MAMLRASTALVLFGCGVAGAAAPVYSAAGIVNAANFTPGPFAPNSVLSIFGSGLARSAQALTAADIQAGMLPTELNSTRVYVDNTSVPLFYVSDTQINFLVPSKQPTGDMRVVVVREGLSGPEITLPIVDAAPALFALNGYVIATHADNSLIAPQAPAHGGETVVIYATGLGKTDKNPANGEIPVYVSEIVNRSSLKVSVGGTILYAGLTPGSAGLYQINLTLPAIAGGDPELRVTIGAISSAAGLKLAVK